ncbi:MAG: hypothetical protein AAGD01_04555 [Acidobacteriota bacterium]
MTTAPSVAASGGDSPSSSSSREADLNENEAPGEIDSSGTRVVVEESEAPEAARKDSGAEVGEASKTPRAGRLPLGREGKHLAVWVRGLLFLSGWFLVLLGVIGWFVPLLHGWLTLFAGAAVLSLVSEAIFQLLRRAFRRWPWAWRKVLKMRRWILRRLPLRRLPLRHREEEPETEASEGPGAEGEVVATEVLPSDEGKRPQDPAGDSGPI